MDDEDDDAGFFQHKTPLRNDTPSDEEEEQHDANNQSANGRPSEEEQEKEADAPAIRAQRVAKSPKQYRFDIDGRREMLLMELYCQTEAVGFVHGQSGKTWTRLCDDVCLFVGLQQSKLPLTHHNPLVD